jgi:aminoglycoside phosphotransferase (APT) family kinase protein
VDFFFRDTIKAFREVVAGWEGFDEYVPKVERLVTNIEAIGRQSYAPNAKGCGFNVLNHGDLHLRNILIRDDSERRVESFYFVI